MKTFVVLGMHRSGTSLIAKGMDEIVDMGVETVHCTPANPRGHWENWVMVRLNDSILYAAGGSWDEPPPEKRILDTINLPDIKQGLQDVVKRFSEGRELWGWKDPRTTLTIRLFLPYLTNPHIICCFREPAQIAKSLHERQKFPYNKGLRLCQEYNRRMRDLISDQYCENAVFSTV